MDKKVEREALTVGALVKYLETLDPALKMAVELVGRSGGRRPCAWPRRRLGLV